MSRTKKSVATVPTIDESEQEIAEIMADGAEETALAVSVPWEITEDHWRQRGEIDRWMDDQGMYPRAYRSYDRNEWQNAIKVISETVHALPERDKDYQHLTGLYVEEQTDDMLLVIGKKWQLYIHIPPKASKTGKKLEITAPQGRENYSFTSERPKLFADFLMTYIPDDKRDEVLDLVCQYVREVRIYVNREHWKQENPDAVHMLDDNRNGY